jgi:predicted nucleotidyltransferase
VNLSDLKQLAKQISVPINHLQYIVEQFELYTPNATVWAFGSRAKGSNRPASNLDLAI